MAGRMKLKLDGFDELLKQIEQAGGTIDGAVEKTMKKSASIMQAELKEQMSKAGVSKELINRMPPQKVTWEASRCVAEVGYKKGSYNPDNLSDGYKVVFLNYGTPKRKVHGQIVASGFIKKAKSKATSKIKKQQEETLNEILGELKNG